MIQPPAKPSPRPTSPTGSRYKVDSCDCNSECRDWVVLDTFTKSVVYNAGGRGYADTLATVLNKVYRDGIKAGRKSMLELIWV
jgi:hypothetical protein